MFRKGLPSAIFLMGPTAAGKTALAIMLAERLNGEIISVDSALVYRGMNIGTAKPSAEELSRVAHRLIDIRDPAEPYSAADFRVDALSAMAEISAAGRVPLLVGGTMLYFKVLLQGLAELPSADEAVRAEIDSIAKDQGWPAVHALLAEVDPVAASRISPNDPQRLQRALEVYRITGKSLTELQREHRCRENSPAIKQPDSQLPVEQGIVQATDFPYQPIQLAIAPRNRQILHDRIAARFRQMIDNGFIEEVRTLFDRSDLNTGLPSIKSVGYRQAWDYLEGKLSYQEMIERGIIATRQLAKRQLTWLRSWPEIKWIYTDEFEGDKDYNQLLLNQALKFVDLETI